LKNSFSGNFNEKVVRNSLNFRWPQTLKFAEITALVPFSTATPVFVNYPVPLPDETKPLLIYCYNAP
jgi:hypothetical protein